MDDDFEIETVNEATVDNNLELVDPKKAKAIADEDAQVAAEKEAKKAPASVVGDSGELFCQRCGHNTSVSTVEVSEADKEAFLASILGNTYYEKEYDLLGGALTITLTTRPAWFSDLIKTQLVIDQKTQVINAIEDYSMMMQRYSLVADLQSLHINAEQKYKRADTIFDEGEMAVKQDPDLDATPLPELFRRMIGPWSDVILNSVLEASVKFTLEVDVLTRHSGDADFWTSATPR